LKNKVIADNSKWQLAFFFAIHILIFAVLFRTIYDIQYSATGLYFNYASKIIHGSYPYRDFAVEYPPFSLIFFIIPRLFAPTWTIYSIIYQTQVVLFDLLGLWLIYDIARRLGQTPWKMITIYTLGILAIGPVIGQQYDIFPAVMTLLAVYFFWREKTKSAWLFLALGTMTKLFPAIIAPVFVISYVCNRQYKQLWTGLITYTVVCLVVLMPFLVTSPGSLMSIYDYHAKRGIQLESTYSSFLMLATKLGIVKAYPAFGFGAWNIVGSVEDILAKLSTVFVFLFLLITYSIFYYRNKACKVNIYNLGSNSLVTILIVLITGKVLSPQYLIWLIPLLPLVSGRWGVPVWIVFFMVGALTYYVFPHNYYELIDFKTSAVAALLFRNILLMLMALLIALSISEFKPEPKTTASDG
jgi:uncharacterized membrane protein